jgi:hypothetical protein
MTSANQCTQLAQLQTDEYENVVRMTHKSIDNPANFSLPSRFIH